MSCGIDVAIGGCALMQLHTTLHPVTGYLMPGAFWLGILICVRGAYLLRRLVREHDGIGRGFARHGGAADSYRINWRSRSIPPGFREEFVTVMRDYAPAILICFALSFAAWAYSKLPPPPPDAEFLLRL